MVIFMLVSILAKCFEAIQCRYNRTLEITPRVTQVMILAYTCVGTTHKRNTFRA